eukprot:TRINITY_DN349_c0_g1_i1.p1 TRINITY_DN349_c0_g1~~TRINITY_DN349_c0_g1_i1.p1  ORF type:complete len:300 (-),score=73.13 TRINITY_DN349_c0_g1_i1:62-832(-)
MAYKSSESGMLGAHVQSEQQDVKRSPEGQLMPYVLQGVQKSLQVQQIVYGELDAEQVLQAVEKYVSAMEKKYMKKLEQMASRNMYLAKELSKVQGRIIASPHRHEWMKSPQVTPPTSIGTMGSQSNLATPPHLAPFPEIPKNPFAEDHDEEAQPVQMTSVSKQSLDLQSPLRKGSFEMSPMMPPVPEEQMVPSTFELPPAVEQSVQPQVIEQANTKQLTTLEIGRLDTAAEAGQENGSGLSGAPFSQSSQKKFYDI